MSFPLHRAQEVVDQLDHLASSNGGNVFVGQIQADPRGENYRRVTIDITRGDWGKLRPKLSGSGWTSFGDGMAHPLEGDTFILALPSF